MEDCKRIKSPFSTTEKLKKGEGARLDNPSFYRTVIGHLQYVVLTRPELAYSVNKLSQYISDTRQFHWIAYKRVLRHLKNTVYMCLKFRKSKHLDLEAYTDADWASDPDERRSINGYCVFLGDINSLLSELKIEMQRIPMIVSDSPSAATIAINLVYHSKTKHFEIDLHFIREKVNK